MAKFFDAQNRPVANLWDRQHHRFFAALKLVNYVFIVKILLVYCKYFCDLGIKKSERDNVTFVWQNSILIQVLTPALAKQLENP
jgi:hypothetical protein